MTLKALLAFEAGLPQFAKFGAVANQIELRVFFHGGIGTIIALDGFAQLPERGVWWSAEAQGFGVLVQQFRVTLRNGIRFELSDSFA